MYCPQCGGANEDKAVFCSACGLDLSQYREQWASPGAQAAGQVHPAYEQPGQQVPQYQPPPYQQYQPQYQAPQYRQPAPYGSYPRISSYLGWAIAVLILCFWPTGIAAVVYASQVDNKVALGDIAGAQESSHKARMWCWISFGIAAAGCVIAIIIVIIAVALAGTTVIH